MSSHERSAWVAYLTEFDLFRYPGGVFALFSLLIALSLIQAAGSTLGVVCVALSLPIMLFAARYRLATAALALVAVIAQVVYIIVLRSKVSTSELVAVEVNFVLTVISLGISFLNPHQFGSGNRPEHWSISLEQLRCAIPVFSAHALGQGDSAPLDNNISV